MARRAVRFTSIAALQAHINSGARSTSRHAVLNAIASGPAEGITRAELSQSTGFGVNVVCGRVAELIADGIVTDLGIHKVCSTSGNLVHAIKLDPEYSGKAY